MTPNDSARDQDAQDDVTELFDLLDAHFGSKGYRIWTHKDGPSQCQDGVVIMFHKFRVTHSTMALYVNSETLELLGRIKPHRCWPGEQLPGCPYRRRGDKHCGKSATRPLCTSSGSRRAFLGTALACA